ncbi:unnamed protein product [Symbiodinium sp. CCMP2456]|nr:unnamed protein product [Symbiodinium sp. CCMP2456]
MLEILQEVNRAELALEGGKRSLWSSFSKTPVERGRASVAGSIKKIVMGHRPNLVGELDTDYNQGAAWLGEDMVAGMGPPPDGSGSRAIETRAGPAWVNESKVAKFLKISRQTVEEHSLTIFGWNVGGGWNAKPIGQWKMVGHRVESEWRGTGVLFKKDSWTLMRRLKAERGTWYRLRHVQEGSELWVGSLYLKPELSQDGHAVAVRDLLRALPTTNLPGILSGDTNSALSWGEDESGELASAGSTRDPDNMPAAGRTDTRPRSLATPLRAIASLDQTELERLAAVHTKPKKGESYQDPADVKVLFRMARHGRDKDAWKAAFQARRKARVRWEKEKLAEACKGNWGAFRRFRKRTNLDWEYSFADAHHEPHTVIHDHLQGIYTSDDCVKPMTPELPFVPISMDELKAAIHQGKTGVSVCHDGTSHDLLLGIMEAEGGAEALRAWFNYLLELGDLPANWYRSLMIVLPKVQRGIRQGSVESPLFFSCLAELTVELTAAQHRWPREDPALPGLMLSELLFVDGGVLWNSSTATLAQRVAQWAAVLRQCGLRINLSKCEFYVSPSSKGGRSITIMGVALHASPRLTVMGLQLHVKATVCEILAGLLAKVVAGAGLWCISGFYPEASALHLVNTFQLQLVITMMDLKRGDGETWLTFRKKAYRAARGVLWKGDHKRLMNGERNLDLTAGGPWRIAAQRRPDLSCFRLRTAMTSMDLFLLMGAAVMALAQRGLTATTSPRVCPVSSPSTSSQTSSCTTLEHYEHNEHCDPTNPDPPLSVTFENLPDFASFLTVPTTFGLSILTTVVGFDEPFEDEDAPAWWWDMVDRVRLLMDNGADGIAFGDRLMTVLRTYSDERFIEDTLLYVNGLLRAMHLHRPLQSRPDALPAETALAREASQIIAELRENWLWTCCPTAMQNQRLERQLAALGCTGGQDLLIAESARLPLMTTPRPAAPKATKQTSWLDEVHGAPKSEPTGRGAQESLQAEDEGGRRPRPPLVEVAGEGGPMTGLLGHWGQELCDAPLPTCTSMTRATHAGQCTQDAQASIAPRRKQWECYVVSLGSRRWTRTPLTPSFVPAFMQHNLQETMAGMSPAGQALMYRSLGSCIQRLGDELEEVMVESKTAARPPTPKKMPKAGPSQPIPTEGRRASGSTDNAWRHHASDERAEWVDEKEEWVDIIVDTDDEAALMQLPALATENDSADSADYVHPPTREDRERTPRGGQSDTLPSPPEPHAVQPRPSSMTSEGAQQLQPPAELQPGILRWRPAAAASLDVLRNCGGGTACLTRRFRGLILNRGVHSYENYAEPLLTSWRTCYSTPSSLKTESTTSNGAFGSKTWGETLPPEHPGSLWESSLQWTAFDRATRPTLLWSKCPWRDDSQALVQTFLRGGTGAPDGPPAGGGLHQVLQSVDLRLSQLEVQARVRWALTLLHSLRRHYSCDGTRVMLPPEAEPAEALLASHAVADEGNDTVNELDNQDSSFTASWFDQLRSVLPLPCRHAASAIAGLESAVIPEATNVLDSDEETVQHPPSHADTQRWLEEEENEARAAASAAQAWDDWAMASEMVNGPAEKRQRLVVTNYRDLPARTPPGASVQIHFSMPSPGLGPNTPGSAMGSAMEPGVWPQGVLHQGSTQMDTAAVSPAHLAIGHTGDVHSAMGVDEPETPPERISEEMEFHRTLQRMTKEDLYQL